MPSNAYYPKQVSLEHCVLSQAGAHYPKHSQGTLMLTCRRPGARSYAQVRAHVMRVASVEVAPIM